MGFNITAVKPAIGGIVNVDKQSLLSGAHTNEIMDALEVRGVLAFPRMNLSDEEQLKFTDTLGSRVNFTQRVPGGDTATKDVYTVTLDKTQNDEPEYVLGTFFWHMDGITSPIPPPKATILTARKLAPKGGQTEFASTYAAYDALPAELKSEIDGLRVVHTVTAAVREVATPEELDEKRRTMAHEQPLVWTHKSGRKSLIIGYTSDYIVGKTKAESRALLARLLEWTAQPQFTYSHPWQLGDLVVWDNCGALHRVVPYATDSGRRMHRTSLAGFEETH
jgi:alpha-ketoglutarate-dependent taurine dioxygenase